MRIEVSGYLFPLILAYPRFLPSSLIVPSCHPCLSPLIPAHPLL